MVHDETSFPQQIAIKQEDFDELMTLSSELE